MDVILERHNLCNTYLENFANKLWVCLICDKGYVKRKKTKEKVVKEKLRMNLKKLSDHNRRNLRLKGNQARRAITTKQTLLSITKKAKETLLGFII